MPDHTRTIVKTVLHYAKIVWEVPAVQSAALTWLIRASVPGAAILIAAVNALVNQ